MSKTEKKKHETDISLNYLEMESKHSEITKLPTKELHVSKDISLPAIRINKTKMTNVENTK